MLRSERPDLGPRFSFLFLWLRWSEQSAAERAGSPLNNSVACCFPTLAVPLLCLLPPAGRGGEERKRPALVAVRSGSGGSGSSLASVRVAERWHAAYYPSSVPPPSCRGGEGMRSRMGSRAPFSRLFKRDLLPCSGGSYRFLPHLAGRGGKGVGQKGAVATGADGGVCKPPEFRLLAASSLRRTLLAVAIQGHRVGHAVLDDNDEVASTFLLCARIFSRAAAATKPPAQPSGFVPG
jgi:hypothetical protein